MWQQQICRNKQFNNHNRIKIIKIQCLFNVFVCVYVENTAMASWKNMVCSPMCACVHFGKVYWVHVFIVGRSKEGKKFTLLTYMCMRVCVCVCVGVCVCVHGRDCKDGPFVFLSQHVRFLWFLATTCRVPVVGKRTSHASSLCVLCAMPSFVRRPLVVKCLT